MVEVLYVLRFEVMMDGRAIPAAQAPLLVRTRLEALLPREGEGVPDLPASLVGVCVGEIDDSFRAGVVVVTSSAWVPGQSDGHFTAAGVVLPDVAVLTASGEAWVEARITEAEKKGWERVASEAELRLSGDFVVKTGGGGLGPGIEEEPGPQVLAITNIRDEAVVLGVRRDGHGPYLLVEVGRYTIEAPLADDVAPPAPGTRGRMSDAGFAPYPDQTLRRMRALDTGDRLGWASDAQPQGFTAPRQDVPGT